MTVKFKKKTAKQCGAVITWKPGISKEQAEAELQLLMRYLSDGTKHQNKHHGTVHEFNPEHGGPVWYVP